MVHVFRVVALVALLLFQGGFAFAFPATANYRVIGCVSGQYFPSVAAAGAACLADRTAYLTATYEPTSGTLTTFPAYIRIDYQPASMGWVEYAVTNEFWSCPSGATLTGATCGCNAGLSESNGSCVAPTVNNQQNCSDAAVAGSAAFGQEAVLAPLASGTSLCIANDANAPGVGCKVDLLDPAILVQPDGRRYVRGFPRRTNTGADTCPTGGAADPATPKTEQEVKDAPKACKGGQQATMNGVTVCQPLPSGTSVTTPKTTTTTSSTGGGVDGNSPTSSSASGQVQCVGGQCTTTTTTTTTTTNPDGSTSSTSSTSTKTESEGDYCRENPKAQQCEEGSWGGSCSAGFVCDGDAVMCAIAQDQHKRNCALFDNPSPQSQLFDTEKNKTGSQVENENKTIGAGSFDTSDALGGGSCIGDKQITVMGWTGSLPFSLVCSQLAILGNVLLVVSFLLAGRIVVRG